MLSFLFHRLKIHSIRKAEAERQYLHDVNRFYEDVQGTGKPVRYEELGVRVGDADFQTRVRNLRRFAWKLYKPQSSWKTSEEYKILTEYRALSKDKDLRRYLRLKGNPLLDEYRSWKVVFEDHFSGLYLDTTKWITRYYAGELFLNDTYAVGKDVHLFKSDNVMMREGRLCLEFRKEIGEGKYWDPSRGIIAGQYAYTSGLVSTALSFRQGQGRFEAKIRVKDSAVSMCFWLAGDGVYPHINVMKLDHGYYDAGCFCGDGEEKQHRKLRIRLKKGCYIFTLDRTAEELVWKINDCTVKRERNRLTDIPLYAVFSLGSVQPVPDKKLPVRMHVEWVRFLCKK